MKNPLDRDDFEIFLEEEVNQHRMYPSDHVWRNIQQEIHGYKKWPALTVITLFVISALVVGTVLIKPQHQTIISVADNAAQKTAEVADKQPIAENAQEHFSSVHITQQTIEKVTADIDITDNLQTAFTSYNNNIPQLLPADYSTVSSPDNFITPNIPAIPVNIASNTGRQAVNKDAGVNTPKNTAPVINWMNMIPNGNLTYDGLVALNIPGVTVKHRSASGSFMFSLFNKLQTSSLNLENNFSEPVHKSFSFKPKSRRFDFSFYATPSISYRKLTFNQGVPGNFYVSGIPYNADYKVDLSRAIRNKPAAGYEVGAALGYKLNDVLTLRGGFQFNMREYDIVAYKQNSDASSFSTFPGAIPGGVDVSNQTSTSINQGDKVVLPNRYYQIAMPLGIDVTGWKSGRLAWGVATSIQPTYIFDKDPFIITSDYKNYVDGSKLVRNWNVNAAFDTYISYATGQFKWQLGPQFRYQLLSTLSGNYPTREHLLDYGIKIGFVKSLP
ncbi:MAG TPA: hypothetical protein VG738_15645 [Chitinophagaceae bacterium]|nr:hypothetical protein [Chitinophagaceae bacterium]